MKPLLSFIWIFFCNKKCCPNNTKWTGKFYYCMTKHDKQLKQREFENVVSHRGSYINTGVCLESEILFVLCHQWCSFTFCCRWVFTKHFENVGQPNLTLDFADVSNLLAIIYVVPSDVSLLVLPNKLLRFLLVW